MLQGTLQILRGAFSPLKERAVWLLGAGVVAAAIGQTVLLNAETTRQAPRLGVVFLTLAVGLAALGSFLAGDDNSRGWTSNADPPRTVLGGKRTLLFTALGLAMALVLAYRLTSGSKSGIDLVFWLAALMAFAVPLLARSRLPQIGSGNELGHHLLRVAALVGIFLALNIRDLEDWHYSAIGDEYAFYLTARRLLEDGVSEPFSQSGVYGQQPVLNSAYQALVMAVFGHDNFGWRLASLLSVAAAIPGVYLLGLKLGNATVALLAAALFAFSHYLFAYAHTGYNNIHSLAPTVWALAFLVLGLRGRNPFALYLAGLTAGLGFYTLFAARATVPIMAIFVLTEPRVRRHLFGLWPVALGFGLAVAPLFVVSGGEVLSAMLAQVPGGYSSEITGPPAARVLANLSRNLLAFNYNPDVFHYVSGPLLDPITAILMVSGMGLALGRLRHPSHRLLLIWVLVAVTATGILSPYPQVAISRLNFVLPPLALLAGFGGHHLWTSISFPGPWGLRGWLGTGSIVALLVAVLALNIRQFWFATPKVFQLTPEAVAMGAIRSEACGTDPARAIIVGRETEPLLKPALASYYPEGGRPRLLDHDELRAGQPLPVGSARCIVFANPTDSVAQNALADLSSGYPLGRVFTLSDGPRKTTVKLFALGAE